jgi:hypothetical protein
LGGIGGEVGRDGWVSWKGCAAKLLGDGRLSGEGWVAKMGGRVVKLLRDGWLVATLEGMGG